MAYISWQKIIWKAVQEIKQSMQCKTISEMLDNELDNSIELAGSADTSWGFKGYATFVRLLSLQAHSSFSLFSSIGRLP